MEGNVNGGRHERIQIGDSGGGGSNSKKAETMSPESTTSGGPGKSSKLQLPPSTDPPGPGNPVKQLVWVVRTSIL
jgi:hypothetical protein